MNQDEALLLVREQDMKKRMNGGQEFIEFLASPNGDLSSWTNVDRIVDSLAAYWVSSSNFKVALLGLDILSLLVERLQRDFQPHYNLIQNALMDRLGDQKDQVRDASITLLTNIMDVAASPQYLFERLACGFSHKVWRVREGVCRLLVATINRFGAKSLYLSKILPHICKLLSDPNGQVRDIAMSTVVEIYRHVGDKVRQDLAKKGLPASRLHNLYEKFDVVLQSGDMVTASETGSLASSTGSFESGDSASSSGLMRPPSSSVIVSRTTSARSSVSTLDGSSRSSSTKPHRSMVPPKSATAISSRSNAGAVDEESFVRDFDQNLPPVRLYGAKDLEEQMSRIQAILSDEKKDWEERTKALKAFRAVAIAAGNEYDSFHQHIRLMEPALQMNAKDLRSQVVRETCVTIGFLSSFVKNQFEHSACILLPILVALIPNAARVMSTSGILSIRTMLKHTHGPRLIPVVTSYCTSRTTSIRRHTFTFLEIIFQNWVTHLLEKHISLLKESVQKGINDADAEAREEARKAWHGLHRHFPQEAEQVFNSLNASQQKLIKGNLSTISSTENLAVGGVVAKKPRPSVTTTGVGPRRSVARAPPSVGLRTPGAVNGRFLRSRSDIDPASAKRSQMKAVGSGYGTLGRPRRVNPHHSTSSSTPSRGRETDRPAASQPGSRSNSPGAQRRSQGLPRASTGGRANKLPSYSSNLEKSAGRSTSNPHVAPPMRVLPKGREGEMALNDALSRKLNRRETYGASDDDMSDTSSVCSDMSSNYTSRNGVKRHHAITEDVVEILQLCHSNLWTERKEGLVGLHALINKSKDFSRLQLKKVLEIFNRMFADPHGKVFSMFLEMLPDFIANYHEHTQEWLYVLLTQLLKKMGSDLLGSVQAKILKALQVARECYPTQLQFNILSRYVIDQTQRPNLKVKIALLHFLLELVGAMEPNEITNTSDTRLALSRVITWTTEPKSQDVRKIAEALVISIFELNAPVFTMMIRVLPKTFQDGAMKVLQGYKKTNDQTSVTKPDGGQVMGRVGVSPGQSVVSPRGSVGTLNLMSPRGSMNGDDSMDRDEIAENFRDITAGIQKLRMDSSEDDVVARKLSYDSPSSRTKGTSPLQARLRSTPHPKSLPSGKENLYNPNTYSDLSPSYSKKLLREAVFDEDAFNEELPLEEPNSNIADVAFAFSSGKGKQRAIDDLFTVLRGSDLIGGLAASQQQIQWDQHFNTILSGVLGTLRTGDDDLRTSSLRVLKEMLRYLSTRFRSHAEVTIVHILESHGSPSKEVTRAAEECGNSLCSLLPSMLTIKVLSPLTRGGNHEGVQACLKMLTNAINRSTNEELTNQIVSDLVPGLLQCYDNTESGIRKAAVFCLVALHRVIGDSRLCQHLAGLSGGKMKLLQLYIKRSQSNAADAGEE